MSTPISAAACRRCRSSISAARCPARSTASASTSKTTPSRFSGATRPADIDTQMQVLAAFLTSPGWRPEYFQQGLRRCPMASPSSTSTRCRCSAPSSRAICIRTMRDGKRPRSTMSPRRASRMSGPSSSPRSPTPDRSDHRRRHHRRTGHARRSPPPSAPSRRGTPRRSPAPKAGDVKLPGADADPRRAQPSRAARSGRGRDRLADDRRLRR